MAALAQLRGDRDNSTGLWGDFSYSAPPRGETILARHPMPVAVTPSAAPPPPPSQQSSQHSTPQRSGGKKGASRSKSRRDRADDATVRAD
mmetsp:Transcript_29903/g.91575  ORF Transcript_29903/g.91575 Transcript_29903/m.91575 type:complete len:90 (-) Transcript_29903:181-450(-)